jgi:3-oxoacyl-[acyl-carrier protein] reductase
MEPAQRRVALVTGSSRGLGSVIARRLARDGFAVAVNGRPGDELVAAVSRAIRDEGGTAEGFHADVTDAGSVAGLAAAIGGCLGPVDVLVVNATGPQPEAPVTEVGWPDHLAQLGLTLSWARELAPFGITVNTVAPGFIPVERHADVPDEERAAYLATVPAGLMGTPADIAHAVSFFASEGAGFVTGQRIVVDGGRSLGT